MVLDLFRLEDGYREVVDEVPEISDTQAIDNKACYGVLCLINVDAVVQTADRMRGRSVHRNDESEAEDASLPRECDIIFI